MRSGPLGAAAARLDRVAARCREAGAPTAEVVPLDQGDAASVERALRGALAAPLDVVVLCGGVGARAAALDTDAATLRRLMETNFLATAELGRRCARHMLDKRRDGRVVRFVGQATSVYPSAPHTRRRSRAPRLLRRSAAELAAETAARVSVTVVAPGYIRTGHSLHALTGDGRAYDKNDASTASGADPAAVARWSTRPTAGSRSASSRPAPRRRSRGCCARSRRRRSSRSWRGARAGEGRRRRGATAPRARSRCGSCARPATRVLCERGPRVHGRRPQGRHRSALGAPAGARGAPSSGASPEDLLPGGEQPGGVKRSTSRCGRRWVP